MDKKPKLIDYRKNSWGHAIHGVTVIEPGTFRANIFHYRLPRVADLILMNSNGPTGAAYYKITKVDPVWDPSDMFWIEAEFVERWEPDATA